MANTKLNLRLHLSLIGALALVNVAIMKYKDVQRKSGPAVAAASPEQNMEDTIMSSARFTR